jgi:outer membrane protein OmpA-like peptidoglycan-associated protein
MTRAWLLVGALGLLGCQHSVKFQGEQTFAIQGTPPPVVAEVQAPPRVEVRDNKVMITEKIQFDYDKAVIKDVSAGLMNEIATVIKQNPQIKKLRVEGYASSEGDLQHNQALSEARSKAVQTYLVKLGVPAGQLTWVGYGEDKPVADNSTEQGREANRRVEFTILEQDVTEKKVEIDAKTGAEKVIGETTKKVTADSNQEANATTTAKKGG